MEAPGDEPATNKRSADEAFVEEGPATDEPDFKAARPSEQLTEQAPEDQPPSEWAAPPGDEDPQHAPGEDAPAAAPVEDDGSAYVGFDPEVRAVLLRMAASERLKENELEPSLVQQLREYPPKATLEVLDLFDKSLTTKDVHNKSAYLNGVFLRHKRFGTGPKLQMDVQRRLEGLYKSGKVRDQVLDGKVLEALATMDVSLALRCIDSFEQKDLSDVRNLSALFMTTVKAVKEQLQAPQHTWGAAPPAYGHAMPPPPAAGLMAQSLPYGLAPHLMGPGMMMMTPPVMPGAYGAGGKRDYGAAQAAAGVRVNELHNLSVNARFVPPEPALRLQILWDSGHQLVSLLDDAAWRALGELDPAHSLQVVNEVAEAMKTQSIRNVNAYFMGIAKKFMHGGAGRAGGYSMMGGGGGGFGGGGGGGPRAGKGVPAMHQLSPLVKQRAQQLLMQLGTLREDHFDEPLVQQLNRLPEHQQLEVLNELGNNDLATVHNIPAYMTGIIKRFLNGGIR